MHLAWGTLHKFEWMFPIHYKTFVFGIRLPKQIVIDQINRNSVLYVSAMNCIGFAELKFYRQMLHLIPSQAQGSNPIKRTRRINGSCPGWVCRSNPNGPTRCASPEILGSSLPSVGKVYASLNPNIFPSFRKVTIRFKTDNNFGCLSCLEVFQLVSGGIGSALRRISSFLTGAIDEQGEESVDDGSPKHQLLRTILFTLMSAVLCTLGFVLLFKTWRPANFYVAANVHVIPCVLLSAVLIWMGLGLFFMTFRLFP